MNGISQRFLWGWAAGALLGLILSVLSVVTEPGTREMPEVASTPPAAVTSIGVVEIDTSGDDGRRVIRIVDAEQRRTIVDEAFGAGRWIADHEGERVAASGVVVRPEDGQEVLRVASFEPLGG